LPGERGSAGLPINGQILIRSSARPVKLLLHPRRVAFRESHLVQNVVKIRSVYLQLARSRDQFPGFAKAVEPEQRQGQKPLCGGKVRVEADALARLRDSLVVLPSIVVHVRHTGWAAPIAREQLFM
jgi:hypothetical protein